jgi:hypothetical protein
VSSFPPSVILSLSKDQFRLGKNPTKLILRQAQDDGSLIPKICPFFHALVAPSLAFILAPRKTVADLGLSAFNSL